MVSRFFLYLIYVSYVLYGWTVSLLGGVWPQIANDINIDVSFLGVLVLINYISSGIASFTTYRIRTKLGTNYSNSLGLGIIFVSMIIFATSSSIELIVVAMALLGFGAGIIDINSNSYVIKAYETKWVSLLHASWGIGATIGPIVMSYAIVKTSTYRSGYMFVAVVLAIITATFVISKQYWIRKRKILDQELVNLHSVTKEEKEIKTSLFELMKTKNVFKMCMCFFLSNGGSGGINAWIATIAVEQKGVSVPEGAITAAIYFFALVIGRIVSGFIVNKVRKGTVVLYCSTIFLITTCAYYIPIKSLYFIYAQAAVLGFTAGPAYPLICTQVKDLFDNKLLSKILSIGGVFGLMGVGFISVLMSATVKFATIDNIQIIPIISFVLLIFIYRSIKKETV